MESARTIAKATETNARSVARFSRDLHLIDFHNDPLRSTSCVGLFLANRQGQISEMTGWLRVSSPDMIDLRNVV